MKPNNLKKQRRNIVPLCYQKKSLSKSNTSLSHLLRIGSYKKRINELKRNNRSLAVALQTARCESAYQSTILNDYARDCNQIRFARLKLQGMAKTITKLVTDLDEVMNCLDVDFTSNNHNLLQKNGPSHEKMKIKAPSVDCIEEVSVLSSENGECTGSSVSETIATSKQAASESHETKEIQLSPSKCNVNLADDLDTPVLFVDDSEDTHVERNSRSKSSRKCILINQTSLTPELDIDFPCVMRKRSSSRRQTQFIPSAPSSRRSSRKSNCSQTLSAENATPKRNLPPDSFLNRKLSSTLMDCRQLSEDNENLENASISLKRGVSKRISSSPPELHSEQYSGKNKIPEYAFVNMKVRGSKDANSSPPNLECMSKNITSHDVNLNMPFSVHQTVIPENENTESNHTMLLCDDMELTEILRPVQQIPSANSPTAVGFPLGPDVQLSEPEGNEELNTGIKKMLCNDKLTENSETVAVFSKGMHLNETENKSYDSVINDKICKNSETFQHNESFNEKHSVSPPKRSSRNRKNVIYKDFLSSDEPESDSTPMKSKVKKNKSHKIQRDTVIFKPKSCRKTFYTKDNNEIAEKCHLKELHENKESQNLFSVYELDVSNSKKPARKTKPKSKTKNSSHNKEISKPLLQNCSVQKLQGINYKFTKNKNSLSKMTENQLLQNCNSILKVSPTVSTDETVERKLSNLSSDNVGEDSDTRIENRQSINSPGDEISKSRLSDIQHQGIIRTPKSEVKRVSFASTDLVCNFTKTSVSKTIAGNKKVQRASKSVFELEGLSNQESSRAKNFAQFDTNKPSGDISETPLNSEELFNFCEETELYTFMLPSDTLLNTTKADEHTSSKKTFSSFTIPSKLYDSYDDKNSKQCKLAVEQKWGKLSLKGNKNSQKKVQLKEGTSCKLDKDIVSMPLHSHSPVVQSRCKSPNKELSSNDLKENIMPIDLQTLNISQEEIQIKSKTSKSHVPLVEDSITIPIDDIIKTGTKSSCKRDNLSQKQGLSQSTPDKTSKKSRSYIDHQTLNISQAEIQNKSKTPKSHAPPVEDIMTVPVDDIIKTGTKSCKINNLSQKQDLSQPTPDKTSKKNSNRRKRLGSSPVLKDVVNLEAKEENRESIKRRLKVVSYKEPPLNKKMRR